ncbi:hypothetical protein RYX36_012018, partial [Vicia faba]
NNRKSLWTRRNLYRISGCYTTAVCCKGKGILYADQQLMEGDKTKYWVHKYASNPNLFHQDFAMAMMKLSDLQVLTMPLGQIRRTCSKVA